MYLLNEAGEIFCSFSREKIVVELFGTLRISPSSNVKDLDSNPSSNISTVRV